MNREQMIGIAASVLALCELDEVGPPHTGDPCGACARNTDRAEAVVDAILPQVSTVEELEALPHLSRLIGTGGAIVTRHRWSVHVDCFQWVGGTTAERALDAFGPLTVVWRPES